MKDYRLGDLVRASTWGALLGAAAGFALGILLAPEEGRKVRTLDQFSCFLPLFICQN